jgi:sulfonate transport system ATP-binding protein
MLTIRGLSKTYAAGTHALDDVTLEVPAGEILAIVGGSGCGKTTMLRLVGGLDRPSEGEIRVDDDVITAPHPAVGVVFQEPRLMPWLRVEDNVGFGIADLPDKERKARVGDALERVGLDGYGRRWPRELSGGQQQRVAIARAFVARPKVLLLDEPFSALDAFTRASLHEHLLALWDAGRPTIVMVTHDVEEAVTLADRIVVMRPKPGRIYETVTAALERPRDKLSVGFDKAKRRVLNALDRSLKARDGEAHTTGADGAQLWW